MGAHCSRDRQPLEDVRDKHVPVPVKLNVYDVGTCGGGYMLNKFLQPFGTGAFHCGVEVYGWEWSYSEFTHPLFKASTGVFSCQPRRCEGHSYQQFVPMGKTAISEEKVLRLIAELEKEWTVAKYDLLRHNCCHFSEAFCRRLGVGSVPVWVTNLAGMGASVAAGVDPRCLALPSSRTCCQPVSTAQSGANEYVEAIPAIDDKDENREVFADVDVGAGQRD